MLNISASQVKVIIIYFVSVILVTGLVMFMIFKYMVKFQSIVPDQIQLMQHRQDSMNIAAA